MAESAVGRAALVLTTDASGAKAGLAKFGNDAKAWADKTGNQLSGQFKSAFLAGGVAGLVGGSLSGGVTENVDTIKAWAFGMDRVKIAVEATEARLANTTYWMERNAKLADEWRAVMTPTEQNNALNKELANLRATGNELATGFKSARGEINRLEDAPAWIKLGGAVGLLPYKEALKAATDEEKAFGDALRGNSKLIDDRATKLQRIKFPALDPANPFNKSIEKLKHDLATIDLDPVQKAIADLGVDAPTPAHLDRIRNLLTDLAERTRVKELRSDFDGFVKSLDDAVRFAGKTADQIERIKLAERGLDPVRLAELDAAIARKERFDSLLAAASAIAEGTTKVKVDAELKFDNAALAKGSAAEVSARVRHEFGGVPQQQLAEQRRGNSLLTGILEAAKSINIGTAEIQFTPI